jgi:hypothetical protein
MLNKVSPLKSIYLSLFIILFLATCNKKEDADNIEVYPSDIRDQQVGLFLPVYMGSYWVYNHYRIVGQQKQSIGIQTSRYDSIQNYFFNYNNSNKFLSYSYWYRDGLTKFRSGQGQLLLTDQYLDSVKGVSYLLDSGSSFKRYIEGGLDTLNTKFGPVACIKTSGTSGQYRWFRYFGYKIGVVREEEYSIDNKDTLNHYLLDLEQYKINR